jgi:hypothetical protein
MGMTEYRARVTQDGYVVAQAYADTVDGALILGQHYAWVYGQDGPVSLVLHEKRGRRWVRLQGVAK